MAALIFSKICRKYKKAPAFSSTAILAAKPVDKNKYSRYDNDYTDFALWRQRRGLDVNPNTFGPLTNLPDYSYVDGRPTPMSSNLARRLVKQTEYAERIVKLSEELDFAVNRHKAMEEERKTTNKRIIQEKLRPGANKA